jgi:hypothetical protein
MESTTDAIFSREKKTISIETAHPTPVNALLMLCPAVQLDSLTS